MKVARLLESHDRSLLMRRIALNLQQLLEDKYLGSVIDDVELTNSSVRRSTGIDYKVTVLKLLGPLVEFYIDISYNGSGDYMLQARTSKDVPGDGVVLTEAADVSALEWFNPDRVTRYLTNSKQLISKRTAIYNYLWLDKISKSLPAGYNFFTKNIIVDEQEICTSQILAPGIDEDTWATYKNDRFHITFAKDGDKLAFLFNTFDGVKKPWHVHTVEELHQMLKDHT